jgi:hypothetical protein
MATEFQEYPKSLYKGGEWDGDHVIVRDASEEGGKRADGYRMLNEPKGEPKKRKTKE